MSWKKPVYNKSPPEHLPLPTGPHAVGYQDIMTPGPAHEGWAEHIFVTLVLMACF